MAYVGMKPKTDGSVSCAYKWLVGNKGIDHIEVT